MPAAAARGRGEGTHDAHAAPDRRGSSIARARGVEAPHMRHSRSASHLPGGAGILPANFLREEGWLTDSLARSSRARRGYKEPSTFADLSVELLPDARPATRENRPRPASRSWSPWVDGEASPDYLGPREIERVAVLRGAVASLRLKLERGDRFSGERPIQNALVRNTPSCVPRG
jgi:hypothetical protein